MAATRVEEAYSERDQTVNAKGEVTEIGGRSRKDRLFITAQRRL